MYSRYEIVSKKEAARLFKTLLKELGQPKSVRNFPDKTMFAEFHDTTFFTKNIADDAEGLYLGICLHDVDNAERRLKFIKTFKNIKRFSTKIIDTSDPFS